MWARTHGTATNVEALSDKGPQRSDIKLSAAGCCAPDLGVCGMELIVAFRRVCLPLVQVLGGQGRG